jgi:ribonuclease G
MSEEILINVTPRETRVALLENSVLQEVHIERMRKRGLVGNIYKGHVVRVLPGMQAAFVDIGLERSSFLHVSDIVNAVYSEHDNQEPEPADISALLHVGMDILVQVLKDPLGTKGARLTTQISIPSRYLVYLPGGSAVGLSTRIEDSVERDRLKDLLTALMPHHGRGGYIVRTVGEGAALEALRADMLFLNKLWELIEARSRSAAPGTLVHEDLPLYLRILRDSLGGAVEKVRVDSADAYARMQSFAATFIPHLAPYIERYRDMRPIFDLYGVEEEIEHALDKKVPLKSGAYLIIDQTEAMTTIDVNTGRYVGHRNLDQTILNTNLEATEAIARQLRLRNLGGIIIIDFIDMNDGEHKRQVVQALERSLASDRAKNHISEVSALGLIEMTRKRTRESLEHVLCTTCPTCGGSGCIKSARTVCYEIFREILRGARQFDVRELRVLAAQEVIDLLLDEESAGLAELQAYIDKPLRLQVETLYAQEQFDVIFI